MDCFSSVSDMLHQLEARQGWKKLVTPRGFALIPPETVGVGRTSVWGDPDSHCFLDSDVRFCAPLMERHYYQQRSIQISFIDTMNMTYYQSRAEAEQARAGLFCYVNNVPLPWFHRYEAGAIQKSQSIVIGEKFLEDNNISLPGNGWDRLAGALNKRQVFIPALSIACREVKNTTINDAVFALYFRGKLVEMLGLLIDYMLLAEATEYPALYEKSRVAARDALKILNVSFVDPPVIQDLACSVGVSKNSLQKAFRQFTGQSIYDYIVALKMERALVLFEDRTLRIEDIARAVGYQSKITFYKTFEKIFACKPSEVRKQILAD